MKKTWRKTAALLCAMTLLFTACEGQNQDEKPADTGSAPVSETAENTAGGALKDGVYQSTQPGHNGPIEYTITVEGQKIAKIEVGKNYETVGVADKALYTDLPQAIIDNQSIGVDGITYATISSMATKRAVEDAIKQAGGNPEDFKKEVEKPEPQTDMEADIVIVGAGGSGLAAAVEAGQDGAQVVLLEKAGYVGGNTMVAGGIYNAPDPALQASKEMTAGLERAWREAIEEEPVSEEHAALQAIVKEQYDTWKESGSKTLLDSPEWYALQTWNGGDKVANLDRVKILAENAFAGMEWLSGLGWEYKKEITTGAGSLYPRTHMSVKPLGIGFIDAYMDQIAKMDNVKILYNTTATKLVQDDTGRVVGVEASDKAGNNFVAKADHGVLLSTGGFARNADMVQEYNTSGKWPDLSDRKSSNLPAMTGDGIRMAQDIGAGLVDMDQIQLLFTCEPKTGLVNLGNFKPNGTAGYLFVNQEGNRFVREDGRRDEICLGMLAQTGGLGYMLQTASSGNIDLNTTTDLGGVPLKDLIDAGLVFYGKTLKEAAEAANIPAETLQATVDAYNAKVDENAEVDEFGRNLFTNRLDGEDWYLVPRAPAVHHTMGGVQVDLECHVLNAEGQVIPGLYAAGEVTGGLHGANRLGGNALVETVVFGKMAGENMRKDMKAE